MHLMQANIYQQIAMENITQKQALYHKHFDGTIAVSFESEI